MVPYCKLGQNFMTKEDIYPKGESCNVIMLNGHDVKLSSKYICLFPQISKSLSLRLKSFYLKTVVVNTNLVGQYAKNEVTV